MACSTTTELAPAALGDTTSSDLTIGADTWRQIGPLTDFTDWSSEAGEWLPTNPWCTVNVAGTASLSMDVAIIGRSGGTYTVLATDSVVVGDVSQPFAVTADLSAFDAVVVGAILTDGGATPGWSGSGTIEACGCAAPPAAGGGWFINVVPVRASGV